MTAVLDDYAAIVFANPYVGRKKKLRLWITLFLLRRSTPGMVRFIGALTKLPGIRSLRKVYKS
ncbi:hypothetical protein D3C72_1238710 [compost metagenome]